MVDLSSDAWKRQQLGFFLGRKRGHFDMQLQALFAHSQINSGIPLSNFKVINSTN